MLSLFSIEIKNDKRTLRPKEDFDWAFLAPSDR